MRKAIKHIIPLCLMLLLGSGSSLAHTLTATHLATTVVKKTTIENTNKIGLEHLFIDQSNADNPVLEIYKKREITVDNEEEDSEISVSKKTLEKPSYIISSFKKTSLSFISYQKNNSFGFRKEISYLRVYKPLYIIFEVFRI